MTCLTQLHGGNDKIQKEMGSSIMGSVYSTRRYNVTLRKTIWLSLTYRIAFCLEAIVTVAVISWKYDQGHQIKQDQTVQWGLSSKNRPVFILKTQF